MFTRRTDIDKGWQVRELDPRGGSEASNLPPILAQVPGHVHLDLMRAGVIADPFYRLTERSAAWVDESDWSYETTFWVKFPAATTYLSFQGLDTVAEITLNGEPLGATDNMFIPHEFPVGDKLRCGEGEAGANTLQVHFRSALRVGRERQQRWIDEGNDTLRPHWFNWGPRSFVRKAQYMYGWDWGPELVSCGIWQPVELVQVYIARLLDWSYTVEFTPGPGAGEEQAVVRIEAFVERAAEALNTDLTFQAAFTQAGAEDGDDLDDPLPAPVSVPVPHGEGRLRVSVDLTIQNPRRWWPNGYADQTIHSHPVLYTLEMKLEASEPVDEKTVRIGLRTVDLVRELDPDGRGESFKFRVNGEDIFIKGANWIPVDSFPSRRDESTFPPEPLISLLFAACDAGINMLRVWGGGLYESEDFYQLCDAHGILVWQDFPYACAYYPDTGEYAEAARQEAIAAVRRLRVHASLAIWCGNNENHAMHHDGWAGPDNRPPRFLGEKLYHEVLPAVVAEEDPGRPYWPSSPYGGSNPNSQEFGDRHDWDVWHGVGDWTHYPEDDSRFLSEFGFASSCGLQAWDRCLTDADRWPRSPAVQWHDKTRKGYETYLGYIRLHFPVAQTLEDLVYYSQLNQAEALKCGIEHWRRRKGHCWGTLFWQLNDCWPVQSWSIIDSALQPKAAYYACKRFYGPTLVSLVRQGDRVEAHLTNDTLSPLAGKLMVSLEDFDGLILHREEQEVRVDANGTGIVGSLDLSAARGREREVYVYALFQEEPENYKHRTENFLFLAEPKDLLLPDPGLEIRLDEHPSSNSDLRCTIKARKFAPYVWWHIDEDRDPSFERTTCDNFFHLRPDEERVISIEKDDVIRSVEDARGKIRVRTL